MYPVGNGFLVACTFHDGGVVFVDRDGFGRAEHVQSGVFEFQALLFADDSTTGKYGDVLQHFLATVAETGSFDCTNTQVRTQTVYYQCSKGFAIYVLGNNQQRTAALNYAFQQRKNVFERRNLLVVDKHVRLLQNGFHLLGVSNEVGREVASVELHSFHNIHCGVRAFGFFYGYYAFFFDFRHRVGYEFADFLVVVGGNCSDLFDFVVVVADFLGLAFDVFNNLSYCLVDTAFQIHGVSSCCYVFQAYRNDGLCQNGGSGSAVAGFVTGFGSDFLHHLGTHVFELVVKFDFFCNGYAVLGYVGRSEFF